MATHRWAIILCRFADIPTVPNQPQFYRDFFSESGAGTENAFDYWKDITYGVVDLTGSKVFGWFTTTKTDADYKTLQFPYGRSTLLQWGLDAAAANGANLTPFQHVAVVFNRNTDSGSTGGPYIVLGMATWHPSFVFHEMGHAHGLGHSFRVNPDTEYGDAYDIMSVFTNYYPFKFSDRLTDQTVE